MPSQHSGLIYNFNELNGVTGVTPQICKRAAAGDLPRSVPHRKTWKWWAPRWALSFRQKAILATLYALAGMLVYIAFRFEWIYGVGAVIAVFHDTLITIGLFSLFNEEIGMTVIAALLTLVGYSMNDTIVIFDRIRENLEALAARFARARNERRREPDVEPDSDDFGPDVHHRRGAVPFWRPRVARVFVCAWFVAFS